MLVPKANLVCTALVLFTGVNGLVRTGQASETWKALYNRGVEAIERGEPRDAIAHFEKARALEPNNAKILHGLVLADLAAGRTAAALETSQRLLDLLRNKGGDFIVSMAVGEALAKHAQFSEAVEFFKLAQEHAPLVIEGRSSTVFFDNLFAALFAQLKQDQEAIERLEHLVDSDPGDPAHYYQLGLMLIKIGSFGRSYESLRRALDKFPRSFEIRLAYALACYFTGRNDQAEEAYLQLTQMRPDSDQPYFALGNFYADTGRDSDAAQAFGRAAKLAPKNHLSDYMYGVELYRTGNIPQAAVCLRKAVELDPRHADSQYWLGKVYLAQGQRELALKSFETAAKLEPKHIGAYYQLALLYKRLGETEKAREALRIRGELMRQLHEGIAAERMTSTPEVGR